MSMKNRTTTIAAKVSSELNEKLDFVAHNLGATKSTLILRLVEEGIDSYIDAANHLNAHKKLRGEFERVASKNDGWVTKTK